MPAQRATSLLVLYAWKLFLIFCSLPQVLDTASGHNQSKLYLLYSPSLYLVRWVVTINKVQYILQYEGARNSVPARFPVQTGQTAVDPCVTCVNRIQIRQRYEAITDHNLKKFTCLPLLFVLLAGCQG